MGIYAEENWTRWEARQLTHECFGGKDKEKDRWMLTFMAIYGQGLPKKLALHKLGISEIPKLPVNEYDANDEQYAPYLALREQVMRESDYWVLKNAAFHAPTPLNRFAFCRLTGYSWPPDEREAYRYRTYSCGLKRFVSREDIVDLCKEMIDQKGPFQKEAAIWMEQLANVSDEELAEMASERTERSWENEPDEKLRRYMLPLTGYSEEENRNLKICSIFDAYIMWLYSKHFWHGSGIIQRDAMEDSLSDFLCTWFQYTQKPARDVLTTIADFLSSGGRSFPGLTAETIKDVAWNVCKDSPQHSFFLFMAYWYGLETGTDDDQALRMLFDAAERGHLVSYDYIVEIYSEGKYVHKNFRLALTWQEKKVERYRLQYEKDGSSRRDYREALRKLGDLLMNEGFARRAKQYYRKADQLENS